jgi:hypothetical protein
VLGKQYLVPTNSSWKLTLKRGLGEREAGKEERKEARVKLLMETLAEIPKNLIYF